MVKGAFASDNLAGLSPELVAAISRCNSEQYAVPYGNDPHSLEANETIAAEVLGASLADGGEGKPAGSREMLYRGPAVRISVVDTGVGPIAGTVGGEAAPPEPPPSQGIRFHPRDSVYLCFGGTGANCLALGGLLDFAHEYVIAADWSHINTDEGAAPEKLAGCKIEEVRTTDGKLCRTDGRSGEVAVLPEVRAKVAKGKAGFLHRPQPRVISVTQPSEYGAVYSHEELRALAGFAHRHGLFLHVDGARISNAAAALGGHSLYENTFALGVDSLSLGLTKNGGFALDAVVNRPGLFDEALRNPGRADPSAPHGASPGCPELRAIEARKLHRMQHLRKQLGQHNSKMRFVSAQFSAMLDATAKVWLRNARQANAVVPALQEGFRKLNEEISLRVLGLRKSANGAGGSGRERSRSPVRSNGSARLSPHEQKCCLFDFPGSGVDVCGGSEDGTEDLVLANTVFVTIPDGRILQRMLQRGWVLAAWEAPQEPAACALLPVDPERQGRQLLRFVGSFSTAGAEVESLFEDLREVTADVLFGKG